MINRRSHNYLLVFFLTISSLSFSQGVSPVFLGKPLVKVKVKKSGPYIGVQRGKYTVGEVGVEHQWKRMKLSNSFTQAVHFGVNYNLYKNVMGYDLGYWVKPHRIGLTYGANVFLRTDFDRTKVGIAPVLGFKFWLLHAQTGYHFMDSARDLQTNTFFISLKIGIINERDVDIKRRKKR